MTETEAKQLISNLSEALEFFLDSRNKAPRHDFEWGCIYWVGPVLRVDIKKVKGNGK